MLLALAELAKEYISRFSYLAIFIVLFLCGLGLPIPEEVTIVSSGYISGKGIANIWLSIIVCILGILSGDLATYYIGRYGGSRFINTKWGQKIISEKRIKKAEKLFAKYGWKTVFIVRFFAGIRMVVYFFTGTMKKNVFMFLLMDFFGCLISVPISVYLGYYFHQEIDKAFLYLDLCKEYVIIGICFLILIYIILRKIFHKRKKEKISENSSSLKKGDCSNFGE